MSNVLTNSQDYLREAVQLAVKNVKNGGGPFGAAIVLPNGKVYFGVNRVTANNDPTAHAEVQAIRNACMEENTFSLEGAVLFSSCEPCPMCLGAALWARVSNIFYAADRFDAADAGFDDAAFYVKLEEGKVAKRMVSEDALLPFELWKSKLNRTEY